MQGLFLFLFLLSVIVFIVGIGTIICSVIKKRPKNKCIYVIAGSVTLFVISSIGISQTTTTEQMKALEQEAAERNARRATNEGTETKQIEEQRFSNETSAQKAAQEEMVPQVVQATSLTKEQKLIEKAITSIKSFDKSTIENNIKNIFSKEDYVEDIIIGGGSEGVNISFAYQSHCNWTEEGENKAQKNAIEVICKVIDASSDYKIKQIVVVPKTGRQAHFTISFDVNDGFEKLHDSKNSIRRV